MEITKIKYWSKVVQQDKIDHVKITYTEHGTETTVHEFGNNSTASPGFYKAFEDFSEPVCLACGWNLDLASSISVRSVSISRSEDKEGNDNTTYTAVSGLKAGHTTATLTISVNHKYLPDGFEEGIENIIDEAKKYVNGERQQVEMEFDGEEPITEGVDEDEPTTTDGENEFTEEDETE